MTTLPDPLAESGTLVVGDVHGCADELRALVEQVRPERVVLVGDAFTKGPDPGGVWRLLSGWGASAVLGNHDARLIAWLDGARPKDREAERCGRLLDAVDPSWRDGLRGWPLTLQVGRWTVVHAGLHPSGDLERTDARMALSLRRWPLEDPSCPHWHDVYTGTRPVIFGHDARRGLVRVERDGEPLLIGLDTGCVYGGKLSGYLPAEDRLVQVDADRAYQAVSGSPPGSR